MFKNGVNSNGANAWFASKKVFFTTAGGIVVMVCTYMATHDPNVHHQNMYMIGAIIIGGLCGAHVQAESKIDAAAVQKNVPDTVVNQNVEGDKL